MRRALITSMLLAVLAGVGCGGSGSRAGGSSTPGAAAAGGPGSRGVVTAQGSDGQLGGALIARPGKLIQRGHPQKITPKLTLPPKLHHGVGVGAEDNCADQDVQPSASNLAHVGDVVFCLMNAMRANAGVPALRLEDQLTRASVGHSQDMVANRYFAHDSQDGRDVVARLKAVGYIPASGDWVIGENLAWGSGTLATPAALVYAWMNSPEHRDNLLSGDFQDVGMGLAFGTPSQDAPDGVTVTTDFGTRPSSGSGSAAGSAAGSGSRAGTAATGSGSGAGTAAIGPSPGSAGGEASTGAVAASRTRAARRRARSARRRRALRRCRHRHGRAHTRCVRAARRIR